MGKLTAILICVFFLSFSSFKYIDESTLSDGYQLPKGGNAKDYLPQTLVIKFKDTPLDRSTLGLRSVKLNSSTSVKFTAIKPIYQFANSQIRTLANQSRIDSIGLNRIYEVEYQSSLPIEKVIDEVLKQPNIAYAEPRFIYQTFLDPDDTGFKAGQQSYLKQVKASDAWTIQNDASGIVIAIVDSGSDLQHPDLAANIFYNTNDPINGLDDDNDGYVDNFMGWDFVGSDAEKIIEDNNPDISADSLDHGVHVSGLASAVTNNGIGIASIAKNAKLMILKAGADNSSTAIYKGYEAIIYAVDHGAKIINCSWGGPGGGAYGQDVINYAISRGCLVVAAAGNYKTDNPIYPAAYLGVFAVANVQANDAKANSSSYGYHIAISAPGTGIYSTINNGEYGYKSGTSMAAPIVSSAAALILAKNPTLNGTQAGEVMRLSADDIYSIPENGEYLNQLGSGRLNVYKAIKSTASPSIRYQRIEIMDSSNGALSAGDTASYYFDLKNVLLFTNNIEVKLSSDNPNIRVVTGTKNVGSFNSLETKRVGPFKVLVGVNTPENSNIVFELDYSNPLTDYQAKEFFSSTVNLDYQNITVNQLYTSITSNGRIGYSGANAHDGLGVLYKDFSMLYEGALMIGVSDKQVSNNARSYNGDTDNDFRKVKGVARLQNKEAAYEGLSVFNDSKSVSPIGLTVSHRQFGYKSAPDDKYVTVEYEVTNNNTYALSNVYLGLFTDWDIDESSKNMLNYDTEQNLAYVYATTPLSPYAAIKLLNTDAPPLFYPLSYQMGTDLLFDANFTTSEKYETLSSGIKATALGSGDGLDVMCVIGNGPYYIPSGKTMKISFAVIVGDDLQDIQKSALAASERFQGPAEIVAEKFKVSQNYPNPAKSETAVTINIPEDGLTSLEVFDYLGRNVGSVFRKDLKKGVYVFPIDLRNLESGLYYYRCTFKDQQQVNKLLVLK